MKFKTILSESIDYSYKPFYVRMFKILHKNGVDDINSAYKFIKDKLDIDEITSSTIALLYFENLKKDGNYDDISQTEWKEPNINDLTEKQMVLGEYFEISPFLFDVVLDDFSDYDYEPLIDIVGNGSRRFSLIKGINVIPYDEAIEIAYETIENKIESEGLDYLSDDFLLQWVKIDRRSLEYNVNQIVSSEYEEYLKKPDNLREMTKDRMIEDMGMDIYDEYIETTEDVEGYLKDIKELEGEKLILNNKLTKVEREIRIIELDLERLTDTIDYGDDEQEYYSMYEEDINELNEKLYRLESIYDEIGNQIGDIEKGLADIDSKMTYIYDIYDLFHNEERFKNLFFEKRKEFLKDEIENDISQYAYDAGMSIGEAIEDGLLRLNIGMEELINEMIDSTGVYRYIKSEYDDTYSDTFRYGGENYVIISYY